MSWYFLPDHVRETWEQQIQVLLSAPDNRDSRMILETMNPDLLLRTALYSEYLFRLVSSYLDFLTSDTSDEDAFTDDESSDNGEEYIHSVLSSQANETTTPPAAGHNLGGLPNEIALRVLGSLTFPDKIRVARSSRHSANLVAVAVQDQATELLARFHLRFTDVRLLLSATGTIISGSAGLALFTAGPHFEPGDLDFFACAGFSGAIVKFLTMAAGYKQISVTGPYDFAKGVAKIRTLKRQHTGEKINVIEGYTDNPLDIVVRFHSTPVFVAWAADRVWHGNPQLTVAGIAITTPSHLPVDDTDQCREHVRGILAKYTGRGFNYSLNEYPHQHICGVDLRCPATLRSSDDEGCLTFNFPPWDLTPYSFPFTHVSWSMGGVGCSNGIRAGSGLAVRPAWTLAGTYNLRASWQSTLAMFMRENAVAPTTP
ncbi:hypothetical protein B0H11DRAFT_1941244 [Mycena galericulata]|nr:hypothetical protein B0H11DRAFT_1941244 [Mycena galericulata]